MFCPVKEMPVTVRRSARSCDAEYSSPPPEVVPTCNQYCETLVPVVQLKDTEVVAIEESHQHVACLGRR